MCQQPVGCGLRKQRAQIGARQQQVRAAGPAEQGVAQHAQKDCAAGRRRRRVERGDAQRLDEGVHQSRGQWRAQFRHGDSRPAAKSAEPPAACGPQQRQPVAPAPAPGAQDAGQRVPGWAAEWQGQAGVVGKAQVQRQTQQRLIGVHAHPAHQAQRFGIGADQDVLAVVDHDLASVGQRQGQRARPAAKGSCRLEHGDPVPGPGGGDRRRHAGPATADDSNPHSFRAKTL